MSRALDKSADRARALARAGAAVGFAMGAALVAYAIDLFASGTAPIVFRVAVAATAVTQLGLAWASLRGRRAGWAFFVSLQGTLAVVTLFGAPKLRDAFDVPLAVALVPAALFGVGCALAALGQAGLSQEE
ncbi:MAG: hypothetical protein D6689_21740 [Deltaproteobacteria bacterium]|nr:MAG: hypothetical protein D6689_21740 [Deltaproteobacteria bacterium]